MRFVENGPSIPDQLLRSRDEGQVVFFCGAGVSRARAKLHDFPGLANAVADHLGSARSSPARQLLAAALNQKRIHGIGSLLPTDRVFSLLEREFEVDDVRNAVAHALRYDRAVDGSAHQYLLDLARGPDGAVRLVTTNFDRLFEEQDSSLERHIPPLLPRPNRPQEWSGVVYLHGRLGDDFTAPPTKEEFVLSSTDFGRAYLADGWATEFIRGLMEQFQLVFVGYAADDPPVQYLLEALNGSADGRLFAFQSGPADVARSLWSPKGVEAIAYSADHEHQALWATLAAWAERARSPDAWRRTLLRRAKAGPRPMQPHERGQIKHLVSDGPGALAFLEAKPPAEWLCVLDPQIRYGALEKSDDENEVWSPFDSYALDDDIPPSLVDPETSRPRRDMPPNAWSAFDPNEHDRAGSSLRSLASLSGPQSMRHSPMAPRLGRLAAWVGTVCNDPITPWWAAKQGGLHPDVAEMVRRNLSPQSAENDVGRAWSVIFTSLEHSRSDFDTRWFEFAEEVKAFGWDDARVLRWANLLAPRVVVTGYRTSKPPEAADDGKRTYKNRLLDGDVKYPKEHDRVEPSDGFLIKASELVRRSLVDAQILETHASGYLYLNIPPIRRDPDLRGDNYSRDFGISRLFFRYVRLLGRLAASNPEAALKEARGWPDDRLFDRLRIWASGEWTFWPVADFAKMLLALSNDVFWTMDGQRDFLLSVKARWSEIPARAQASIVSRILKGPDRFESETPSDYRHRRAYRALERLEWLANEGCDLGAGYPAQRKKLIKAVRTWKAEYGTEAVRSMEGTVGFVGSDEDPKPLEGVPAVDLLSTAARLGARDWGRRLEEKRPYRGVVNTRPVRAFRALMLSGLGSEFSWAWDDFFYSDGRKTDGDRFRALIGSRLAQLPAAVIRARIRAIARWIEVIAEGMPPEGVPWFASLWSNVIAAVREDPTCCRSGVHSPDRIDWIMLALNSAAGDLAQALMSMGDRVDDGAFNPIWLGRIESLLGIGGEVRRYASVLLLRNLAWFNHWAPAWTEEHLLALRHGDDHDREAFWHGVLSARTAPPKKLFAALKDEMLSLAAKPNDHDRTERLAGFLLIGWSSREKGKGRSITNDEMRDLLIEAGDAFRSQVLWHLNHWSKENRKWKLLMREFLAQVWPRQRIAKSPAISSRLFDLAIESDRAFVAMVDLVEPLMTTVDGDATLLFKVNRKTSLVERQPQALLKLLFKALPRDAGQWPWGAEEAVTRLGQQASVAVDNRMVELRRRLAAR